MSSLLLVAQAAENEDFRRRVKAAIFYTAAEILRSPDPSPAAAKLRHAASSASGAADTLAWQMAWLIAADVNVRDTITADSGGMVTVAADDAAVLSACYAAWQVVAGMSGGA